MRSHRDLVARAASLLASALTACSGEGEPDDPSPISCWNSPPPYDAVGEAELGGGDERTEAFEPLEPDEEVTLFYGPQGGYHILVKPRVRGLTPGEQDRIDTRFFAYLGDDRVDPFECPHHPIYSVDPVDGDSLVGSLTTLIIVNERVPDVVGQPVLLRMEALDRDGNYARDERRVIPRLEETDAGLATDDSPSRRATQEPLSDSTAQTPQQALSPCLSSAGACLEAP
jgi:hypothetical protein